MAHKEALAGRLAKQARQIQARKGPQNQRAPRIRKVGPTPEREERNPTQTIGMARRVVPMIDTLRRQERITADQHAALKHYRDTADLAHRSPIKSNLDRQIRASQGFGEPVAITSAKLELSRLDRILGPYTAICVAVCRDDMSLEDFCIEKFGAVEVDEVTNKGRLTGRKIMEPVDKRANVQIALSELRYAADVMGRGKQWL